MNDATSQHACSISDVEREIGVAKETLRVWERRYGFPQPLRDGSGERLYPLEQLDRLRLIKRLIDAGYRPGKLMQHDMPTLTQLAQGFQIMVGQRLDPALQTCMDMIKAHQIHELRSHLSQVMLADGLQPFVLQLVAPLTRLVGEAWARGEIAVFEEHLYTESLQVVMRSAILSIAQQSAGAAPRVLLTTVPQEKHALGLLMVEALLALAGAHCMSLGVQTPIGEMLAAAERQQADVLALSFSQAMNPRHAMDSLQELRQRLPPEVELSCGGGCALFAQAATLPAQVLELTQVSEMVAAWRQRHARPA